MHRDINSIYQVAQNPQLDFDCFQGWCIYQPLSVFHLSLKHVLLTTSLNLLSFCLKPSSLILSQKAFQIITLEFKWILLKKFYSSRQDILCLSKVWRTCKPLTWQHAVINMNSLSSEQCIHRDTLQTEVALEFFYIHGPQVKHQNVPDTALIVEAQQEGTFLRKKFLASLLHAWNVSFSGLADALMSTGKFCEGGDLGDL